MRELATVLLIKDWLWLPLVRRMRDPRVTEEYETLLVGQQDVFFPPQHFPPLLSISHSLMMTLGPLLITICVAPFNNSSTPVHNFNSRSMR